MGIVRSLVTVTLAVAMLGITGCSDDDATGDTTPTSSSSISTSPSASESPTPDEPTKPEWPTAANGTGDKAARAFARYWLEMVNYAQSTGDTAPLEDLHTDHCSACKSGVAQVNRDWNNGKSLIGGEYAIEHLRSMKSPEKPIHIVEVQTRYSKQRKLAKSGKVIEVAKPDKATFRLYMKKADGSWVVAALESW